MKHLWFCSALLALTLLAGCSKSSPGQTDTQTLKGVVVDVFAEPPALLVDHDEIPGFMGAMTMRFAVDAATVTRVQKGQSITARLRFSDGKWRLDQVQVVANP